MNWRCYIEHFQEEGAPQSGSLRYRCFFTAYETNIIVPLKSLRIEVEMADVYNKVIFS
ncbi:hypothetical protein MYAER_0602 [Microcystis aeruginosa NIES-2549]|uniref:Uncharacterized protein n=1 Tax=Microcystis aeruginosa NIES-2549 TaxID=1641812 RepID=A0A0F6U1T8_MICAE|nr:hypothetical protein MYAER_0602 [Microcystis aeruginosa NIES-2549]AOC51355.1 hypothetical protein amyaer_0606 [Microcystis aeruginosa NIES-2481]